METLTLFDIIFVIACGIGAINSYFMAIYYYRNKKGDHVLNKLFALLIMSFALRVTMTVLIFFYRWMHPFDDMIWFFSFALMVILYTGYIIKMTSDSKSNLMIRFISILSGIILLIMIFLIESHELLIFRITVALLACTVLFGSFRVVRYRTNIGSSGKLLIKWLKMLTGFMWIILLNAILICFVKFKFLTVEALLITSFIYILIAFEIKQGLIPKVHNGLRKTISVDNKLKEQLKEIMEIKKVYRDPDLTLPLLSKAVITSPHYLSRLLNNLFGVNFNDYVNRYRIGEIKNLLAKPENHNLKISYLAFEYGFNSLSVFNSAFKKFTGKTPSQYQSEILG